MKKLSILLILVISVNCADLSVKQIQDMVIKIHQKRAGIKLETLDNTKEPFVHVHEESNITTFITPKKEAETKLILHAILNGKAYINDEWKKIDDAIGGYTLKYIGKRGIVLRNENQIKKLFLHKDDNEFIMIKERE